jgi:hypothetical protein
MTHQQFRSRGIGIWAISLAPSQSVLLALLDAHQTAEHHQLTRVDHRPDDLGAAGADAFTIPAVAGHASVATSQRYVHPVPEIMMLGA